MNLNHFIRKYKFSIEICDKILNKYSESDKWTSHTWTDIEDSSKQDKSYDTDLSVIYPENHSPCELVQKLMVISQNAVQKYTIELDYDSCFLEEMSIPRLNKYEKGEYMREHMDHIKSLFDGESRGLPAVSLIGLLNDDYEGGELVINGEDYPLKKGELVIFPSNFMYMHKVNPVLSGKRFSYVAWSW